MDFVTFDTETTGLWWGDRLVEIAAVRFRGDAVLGRWGTLVDPERAIPAVVTALHGIDNAAVVGAPRAAEALAGFARFAAGAVLLAHNADFDRDILATELARAGILPPVEPLHCTLALARRLLPEAPRHGLARLSAHLGLDLTAPHRAGPDAERARQVFLACAARLPRDATLAALGERRRFEDGAAPAREGARALRRALRAMRRGEAVRARTRDGDELVGRVTGVWSRGDDAAVDLRSDGGVAVLQWSRVASLRRVR